MASVVELSELAVMVLKKYSLSTCGLAELASEVGVDGTNALDNWKSIVFSIEEVKFAIHDAYTFYCVGDELIRMIEESSLLAAALMLCFCFYFL
ncbi:hypothetical protein Ddye_028098 [Dipteronia dyeriana]|uniref:Uncharacterized protein n=1 Tax=Dipteronia dyeriana TaxID=168575 RepID=A0AAD9TQV7_9ROSI|nr:hypothetical protein Ddye_028098 [Dipteronia dyeriana]